MKTLRNLSVLLVFSIPLFPQAIEKDFSISPISIQNTFLYFYNSCEEYKASILKYENLLKHNKLNRQSTEFLSLLEEMELNYQEALYTMNKAVLELQNLQRSNALSHQQAKVLEQSAELVLDKLDDFRKTHEDFFFTRSRLDTPILLLAEFTPPQLGFYFYAILFMSHKFT